jgi:hypothetical protein
MSLKKTIFAICSASLSVAVVGHKLFRHRISGWVNEWVEASEAQAIEDGNRRRDAAWARDAIPERNATPTQTPSNAVPTVSSRILETRTGWNLVDSDGGTLVLAVNTESSNLPLIESAFTSANPIKSPVQVGLTLTPLVQRQACKPRHSPSELSEPVRLAIAFAQLSCVEPIGFDFAPYVDRLARGSDDDSAVAAGVVLVAIQRKRVNAQTVMNAMRSRGVPSPRLKTFMAARSAIKLSTFDFLQQIHEEHGSFAHTTHGFARGELEMLEQLDGIRKRAVGLTVVHPRVFGTYSSFGAMALLAESASAVFDGVLVGEDLSPTPNQFFVELDGVRYSGSCGPSEHWLHVLRHVARIRGNDWDIDSVPEAEGRIFVMGPRLEVADFMQRENATRLKEAEGPAQ